MMKKLSVFLLSVLLVATLLAGCSAKNAASQSEASSESVSVSEAESIAPEESEPEAPAVEGTTIRLGGLKGPTSMGMVKLLQDSENGETVNTYEFTLAGAADELTPKLIQGELDVLAVPVNLASVLYGKTEGNVQLMAVNTLGVVYIVEQNGETVSSLADLKGKTIYATGKGTTPEYVLNYLLAQNGLTLGTDVQVEWKSEASEVVSLMATMDNAVAMLPQPYVTVAQTQLENLRVALDLTAEWEALDNGSMLVTGGLLVRSDFAKEHPDQLKAFLQEYAASTEYANTNPTETAQLIEKYGIFKAAVAEKALPYCNIVCLTDEDMVSAAGGYLQVLFDQNPASVGGALPDDAFYWKAN